MKSRFSLSLLILCGLLAGCAGCGKKESPPSGKKQESPEKPKPPAPQPQKKKPEPPPPPETAPARKKETPEEQKPSPKASPDEETEKESEAETLYREIMALKEAGEYRKAILKANDLMGRLPHTPQAKNMIPVFHKLKKMQNIKRSCNANFKLLTEAASITDRYAAEKLFLENPETGGQYLSEKLPGLEGKEFKTVLRLLTKMKSSRGLKTMASLYLENKKPAFQGEIAASLLKFESEFFVSTVTELLTKNKNGADTLLPVMQRTKTPELLTRLGIIYAELPGIGPSAVEKHVHKAANTKGPDLLTQISLVNALIAKHYNASITNYMQKLQADENRDALSAVGSMREHLAKIIQSNKEGALHSFLKYHTSSSLLAVPGINYKYYETKPEEDALKYFSAMKPLKIGVTDTFSLKVKQRDENFALLFKGLIRIPRSGKYTFYTKSDDGSRLYIGETCVVKNDGYHGMENQSGSLELTAGFHPIIVTYFQGTGGLGLETAWKGPEISKQPIPASVLFHY